MEQHEHNKGTQQNTGQEGEGALVVRPSIEALCTVYGGSIVLRRWLAAIIDFIIMLLFASFWNAILKVFFQIHTLNISTNVTSMLLDMFRLKSALPTMALRFQTDVRGTYRDWDGIGLT
ncbi:hypothetical protein [Paenibacillus radicis (ex Gao et al. 2016)]|uniref:Uncharacterized protein n=1 Tax=Paenibacillus radicis (ex Gao et al. 2016) TaxID=1737354 RepID=A0A917H6U1_9BACL|nr:hypothetical protein [Paenibacillus radicis (ex Gao et al. 2016)]GGG68915.1 hypothetical protein GCM10010918_24950 [Paenibacillus radicis (ex Gao et al. 2016)]